MRAIRHLVTGLLMAIPVALAGQGGAPTLTLGKPRFTTDQLELDRVRGAGLLPDGRIAIANAGTSNVVILNRRGTVDKRFGRAGAGPGDFGGLDRLTTFGDTIVTWDGLLLRITLWRADGTVIRSFSPEAPPGLKGLVSLESIKSPSGYVATVRVYDKQPRNGVYLNTVALFAADGTTRTSLGQHPWTYSYFYGEKSGSASYATPFLGESLVESAAGKIALLTLGEARVALLHADGTRGSVTLPIKPVTGRERAKVYGDAMIAAEKAPDPQWVRKIRLMFGSDFPMVERQGVAQRAVAVGSNVWFQEFRQPQDSLASWWIVDARHETLIGRVALPATAKVLGGNDQQVLVLRTDADGVQSVAVYDTPRR
ncbi:MAG: hypothetical protein V4558_13705 [Gemmatimonadota bacterium]